MDPSLKDLLPKSVVFLRSRLDGAPSPEIAVVLGSGLGRFADVVADPVAFPFGEVPGFAPAGVAGHGGRLILGRAGMKPLAVLQGRLHYYEGHSLEQVVFPIRMLRRLGVKTLILTSAVGGIADHMNIGDIMVVNDHINFMGVNPLRGPHDPANGERFPDMSAVYTPELRTLAKQAAADTHIYLKEGVYLGVSGPSYETPAEIQLFKQWGADAVGMSMVLEAVAARQEGLRVLGLACVANRAAGLSAKPLSHEDVLEAGQRTDLKLVAFLSKIIELL